MTEEQLVSAAREITSNANWQLGELAYYWCEKYAQQRTDRHFAELCEVTADLIWKCRSVYEFFAAPDAESFRVEGLTWTHHFRALRWDDAGHWLELAAEHGWSVAKMLEERDEELSSRQQGETKSGSTEPATSTTTGGTADGSAGGDSASMRKLDQSGSAAAVGAMLPAGVIQIEQVRLIVHRLEDAASVLMAPRDEMDALADELMELSLTIRKRMKTMSTEPAGKAKPAAKTRRRSGKKPTPAAS